MSPTWNTPLAVILARRIYATGELSEVRMLAAVMEETGLTDPDVLEYMKSVRVTKQFIGFLLDLLEELNHPK